MGGFTQMPRAARAYWALVVLSGVSCLARSLAGWHIHEDGAVKFCIYIVAAIVASGLKIKLPGIFGTLSMNYVVIILAIQEVSLNAAIAVGIVSTLAQCLIHTRSRPKWFQVLFSVGGIPVPVISAYI